MNSISVYRLPSTVYRRENGRGRKSEVGRRKTIIRFISLAILLFSLQCFGNSSVTLKGRVALSLERAFISTPTSAHSKHLLNMAMSQHAYKTLSKARKLTWLPYVLKNLQQYLLSYKIIDITQTGHVIHYNFEVTWNDKWDKLLASQAPSTLHSNPSSVHYFIHVDPKLLAAMQTPLLPFLKKVEAQLLMEQSQFGLGSESVLIPAMRIQHMTDAQRMKAQSLCHIHEKGLLWIDFQHQTAQTFKKKVQFVPCPPKQVRPSETESLHTFEVMSKPPKTPWIIPDVMTVLASQSPVLVGATKHIHVQFQLGLDYVTWQTLDQQLSLMSKSIDTVQDVELYRLSAVGPDYDLQTKQFDQDARKTLTQALLDLCEIQHIQCRISYGLYQTEELWQVVGTKKDSESPQPL